MIEYALLGGFVAVIAATFFPPAIYPLMSTIMSKTTSVLARFS